MAASCTTKSVSTPGTTARDDRAQIGIALRGKPVVYLILMKRKHASILALPLLLSLGGCGEPYVWVPGGKLAGVEQSPPALWVDIPEEVQVEFRPDADPYSVNLWAVAVGADVYIATGSEGTRWTEMLNEDQAVRLRVGQQIYRLNAARLDDPEEALKVRGRYIEKYSIDPDSSMLDGALVYRLDR